MKNTRKFKSNIPNLVVTLNTTYNRGDVALYWKPDDRISYPDHNGKESNDSDKEKYLSLFLTNVYTDHKTIIHYSTDMSFIGSLSSAETNEMMDTVDKLRYQQDDFNRALRTLKNLLVIRVEGTKREV